MTKAPRVGNVKSRLASELGEAHAAGLYKAFLLDILDALKSIDTPFIIYYTPEARYSAKTTFKYDLHDRGAIAVF